MIFVETSVSLIRSCGRCVPRIATSPLRDSQNNIICQFDCQQVYYYINELLCMGCFVMLLTLEGIGLNVIACMIMLYASHKISLSQSLWDCWTPLTTLYCPAFTINRLCYLLIFLLVRCNGELAGPASRLPSAAGALAGRGDNLRTEQTGGAGRAAETVWPGDAVSSGGPQRSERERDIHSVTRRCSQRWKTYFLYTSVSLPLYRLGRVPSLPRKVAPCLLFIICSQWGLWSTFLH